jgi:hypothetical protein
VSLVNLYAETIGNPAPPARIGKLREQFRGRKRRRAKDLAAGSDGIHCRCITDRACHCVSDFRARHHAHAQDTYGNIKTSTERHCVTIIIGRHDQKYSCQGDYGQTAGGIRSEKECAGQRRKRQIFANAFPIVASVNPAIRGPEADLL